MTSRHAAARWLAPSVIAAALATLAAGFADAGFAPPGFAGAGFLAPYAFPLALVASVAVRGMMAAWRPRAVIASLVEPHGGAPQLAGWVAAIWLAGLGLVLAMFHGTWLLARWTAFKPSSAIWLEPLLGTAALVTGLAVARPVQRLVTWVAQRVRPSWWRPWSIFAGAALATIGATLVWRWLVGTRLGALDARIARGPIAAALALALAHGGLAWAGGRRWVRWPAGGLAALALAAAVALALHVAQADSRQALAIWAESPLAGRALGQVFDLETIRAGLPSEQFRLAETTGRHPDLLLVTVEGLRADRVTPPNPASTLPVLRELAARGAVFERAVAATSAPQRALAALLTGLAPNRLRTTRPDDRLALALDPRHILLAERLRAGGYATTLVLGGAAQAGAPIGWSRGIDRVEVADDARGAGRTARGFVAGGRPQLVWIHLALPALLDGDPRAYEPALAEIDAMLAEVLRGYADRPPERAPLVVVTAPFAAPLGEHGQLVAGSDASAAQLAVPLLLAGPGIPAHRVAETVALTDLAGTLLDLAGFAPPRLGSDRSFADLATGRRAADASAGVAFAVAYEGDAISEAAIVRGAYKLVDTGRGFELYDLATDPGERTNLFGLRAHVAGELKAILSARRRLKPPF